MKVQC